MWKRVDRAAYITFNSTTTTSRIRKDKKRKKKNIAKNENVQAVSFQAIVINQSLFRTVHHRDLSWAKAF